MRFPTGKKDISTESTRYQNVSIKPGNVDMLSKRVESIYTLPQLPTVTFIISLPVPAFCDTMTTCSPVSSTMPMKSFSGLSFLCFK